MMIDTLFLLVCGQVLISSMLIQLITKIFWYKYEVLSNIQLRDSDTAVVSGYGVHLKVEYDSLVAECELGHAPGRKKLMRLDRGVHETKQIFICSHGGYVSFEAIDWCAQQGITVFLLNWRDDAVAASTPRQYRSAKVVYLQYMASELKRGVEVARELIRCKTMQQMVVLRRLPDHVIRAGKNRQVFKEGDQVIVSSRLEQVSPMEQVESGSESQTERFEAGLEKLASLRNVDAIRMLEAQLARAYWLLFIGIPITWERSDREKVPRHWLKVPERVSGISSSHTAQHATNPFHATLNFAYALLKAQVLQSILIHGLDETIGFLHVSREGGQPLVYDLMEPFRSVVDASVLDIFGKQTFKKGDFNQTTTGDANSTKV